jgi:hypothetical protein
MKFLYSPVIEVVNFAFQNVGPCDMRRCVFYMPKSSLMNCIVATNLALRRPAWQSSTVSGFTASKSVDGNKDSSLFDSSCSYTDLNVNPWWVVDMGNLLTTRITGVNLTNREDDQEC